MSSNPFLTYFGLLQRSPNLVEMFRHDSLPTAGYQLWAAGTLDDAYGNPAASGVGGAGPDAMFQVTRGQQFRSPTLRRKGLGFYETNRRGQTHIVYDIEDYITVGGEIPTDDKWHFIRAQENRSGVGLLTVAGPRALLGPIYCVPPATFFGMPNPSFTLTGTAPSGTTSAAGAPPVYDEDVTSAAGRPLHIVFTRPLVYLTVFNDEAGGGNNILISMAENQRPP